MARCTTCWPTSGCGCLVCGHLPYGFSPQWEVATALLLVWTAVRRFCSTVVTAIAIGAVFFVSPASIWQELSGRFYGTFLAFAALASLLFLITAEDEPRRRDLAATGLAHACLVGSHILGIVYSVSLVAGAIALDRRRKRVRLASISFRSERDGLYLRSVTTQSGGVPRWPVMSFGRPGPGSAT